MEQRKRLIILVVVAVILAVIAISMSFFGSEVSTNMNANVVKQPVDGGRVGITVGEFSGVEDKLAGGSGP